jgi:hypothetical protein
VASVLMPTLPPSNTMSQINTHLERLRHSAAQMNGQLVEQVRDPIERRKSKLLRLASAACTRASTPPVPWASSSFTSSLHWRSSSLAPLRIGGGCDGTEGRAQLRRCAGD